MNSRIFPNSYPPSIVDGSKIAVMATCMCMLGVSKYRKDASRPDSRSTDAPD
jgi:hypothetical protein